MEKVIKMKDITGTNEKVKIATFLTRDELDFLDKLSKDARFSTGHKLTRTDIVRALIDVFKTTSINTKGISSKSELEDRLLALTTRKIRTGS